MEFAARTSIVLMVVFLVFIVGGVLLEMNGKRYDNTLRHRLEAIHAALTAEA